MKGAELAARYAFPPNNLGYCGSASFPSVLRDYLAGGGSDDDRSGAENTRALENELKKFKAHYAYLSLIARENGRRPFDIEVVRAFWIGNKLLDFVSPKALRDFVMRDLFAGTQKRRAKKLATGLPGGVVPHHSFNPLYINFVTDKVEKSTKNYDSCCITCGRVLSVSGKTAKARRDSIAFEDGRFIMKQKTQSIALERNGVRFVSPIRPGDFVSIHWGMAIQKLDENDCSALKKYTQRNIDAMDASR